MKNQVERFIYKLMGVAGALQLLAASQEITEIGEELQELINLLTDEVRDVYQKLEQME